MLGILNDILDFSKVEAGKMSLDPVPFSMEILLTDLATILQGALGQHSLELIYDIDPAVPDLLIGDAQRLKQVLINLGGNAIKFTEEGHVQLRLQVLQQHTQAVRLRFAMQDTGIGIAEEALQNLFSAFSQAENSTSRRYGGTGLGLSISQRLVTLMGGNLQIESEPGRGSCFYFDITLPVAGSPAQAGRPQELDPGNVLLLEPHPVSQQAISQMLSQRTQGELHRVENVAACLQALEDAPTPALAVLNCDLPGVPEVIDRLRTGAAAIVDHLHPVSLFFRPARVAQAADPAHDNGGLAASSPAATGHDNPGQAATPAWAAAASGGRQRDQSDGRGASAGT